MEEKFKNIYEGGETGSEEQKRLEEFEFPSRVSFEAVGEDVEGKRIIDLGSGPNTDLKNFVEEREGKYVAFDISPEFLARQHEAGSQAVRGSVLELPFKDASADITHMRFVLMHLLPENRKKAIQEAARVAKDKALFLEYDWSKVEGGQAIEEFRDFNFNLMRARGIEPFMGKKLQEEVSTLGLTSTEKKINEGPGNYYHEVIPIAKMITQMLEKMGNEEMLKEAKDVLASLEAEAAKEEPENFTRPDIVIIEIKK